MTRYRRTAVVPLLALLMLSCDDTPGSTAPDTADFWVLTVVSGDKQVAAAGTRLPAPLAVRVHNRRNNPVAGVTISWTSNDASLLDASTSVTDGDGIARVQRTLGPDAGTNTTTATMVGDTSKRVTFTAVALVHGALEITRHPVANGNNQQDTVLTVLAPYRVLVRDHNQVPVAGVRVEWTVSGRGSISSAATVTDANGMTEVRHRLGTLVGAEHAFARVFGLIGSPVAFEAQVRPGAPTAVFAEGNGQVARVGGTPGRYRARVTDAHANDLNAVADFDWAVKSGGGTISPGAAGTADHTLGPVEGEQIVTATVRNAPHLPPATFTAFAVTEAIYVGQDWWCYGVPFFWPGTATVPAGKTVGWIWGEGGCDGPHDLVFEDDPNPPVSTPARTLGSHVRKFTGPTRTIRFRCTRHSTNFDSGEVGKVNII